MTWTIWRDESGDWMAEHPDVCDGAAVVLPSSHALHTYMRHCDEEMPVLSVTTWHLLSLRKVRFMLRQPRYTIVLQFDARAEA